MRLVAIQMLERPRTPALQTSCTDWLPRPRRGWSDKPDTLDQEHQQDGNHQDDHCHTADDQGSQAARRSRL